MSPPPLQSQKPNRRKRRRRQLSISSSSDDDSSSDDEVATSIVQLASQEAMEVDGNSSSASSSESSSSSSSDSSASESDSDSDAGSDSESSAGITKPVTAPTLASQAKQRTRYPTNSPSPPPDSTLPSFFRPSDEGAALDSSNENRDKFRTVYMNKIVEGFGGELEKMRESDPTLGPKRLQLLIDSLASGIDLYTHPKQTKKDDDIDEVTLLIGKEP
ncbi:hypothetical protein I312_101051 [Cryptococcus bacillisporus CA1280]|uniref:uncharacterized protein n=1 Tax=Cryptococcus bacillisporus CA1280 TaxID=1296109 RepID=UPI0033693E24